MTLGELFGHDAKLPDSLRRLPISGLTADSREVKPGYLFAALPGVNTDGARFIADALQRGAAAILVPEGAKPQAGSAAIIEDSDPRRRLALIAARFFGAQPEVAVAVTGTNGKTSVASFVRQLWSGEGLKAASLGTVGLVSPSGIKTLAHTTPDPIELHRILAALAKEGVTIWRSKHRATACNNAASMAFGSWPAPSPTFRAIIWTITRASMTISRRSSGSSPSFAARRDRRDRCRYRAGKGHRCGRRRKRARSRHGGMERNDARLLSAEHDGFSQVLTIEHDGNAHQRFTAGRRLPGLECPRRGGSRHGDGSKRATVLPALQSLRGARGRLDLAGTGRGGAPIFIDYAHTPDALAKALDALRPYVERRLVVVFGCGGDRDKGKRPEMGKVAVAKADRAIVTDDNPRSETPRRSGARSWRPRPERTRSATAQLRSRRRSADLSAAMSCSWPARDTRPDRPWARK